MDNCTLIIRDRWEAGGCSHSLPSFSIPFLASQGSIMKLTKASIAALELPAGKRDHIEWDTTLPGFGVRVRTSGKRTFIVQYRVGHAQRRETLGDVRELDLEQARRAAKRKLGAVRSEEHTSELQSPYE